MTSAPDILIRQARPDDAAACQAILRDTFESTWLPELTAEAAGAFRSEDRPAAYVGERGLLFHVAEVGGQVVGFIDWNGDFINALHVRASHARTGVGGRLMDRAEAAIAEAGFPAARLETTPSTSAARPSTPRAATARPTAIPTRSGTAV